jgi:RNA polymerase sigma factor (sigma-70 family)
MEDGTGPDLRATLERRRALAQWVAREIMPHEPRIRAWFVKRRIAHDVIDELVQDAYCRVVMLETVDHIECAHAYFFSICRNLLARRLKRQQIAPFDAISEIESYRDTGTPTPEEQVATRLASERVRALLADLPERCRRIVELRKIEGWSQREIADHLGITEKAVEKQVWVGVRAIRSGWDAIDREPEAAGDNRRVV